MIESREWFDLPEHQRKTIEHFQSNLPIKLGALAAELGIYVKRATLPANISGEIKEDNGVVTIRVNRHDAKTRQRFTLAHEIAHFLLHRHLLANGIQDDVLYRSSQSDLIEAQANRLAADILMPIKDTKRLLSELSSEHQGELLYEAVAENLDVSPIALKIRLDKKKKGLSYIHYVKKYKYAPILSLQPAEMAALEELPNKDKDLILPVIPLKGWTTAKHLRSSVDRVNKAIGSRSWIADIDQDYLNDKKNNSGEYPDRPVFKELAEILEPSNGYENWLTFLGKNPQVIPTVQLGDLTQLDAQIKSLVELGRGVVVRFTLEEGKRISAENFNFIFKAIVENEVNEILFLLDYGDINRSNLFESGQYAELIKRMHKLLPSASFSISATSFPYSFAGSYRGELPIYERQVFDKVSRSCEAISLIYSDRGSARAGKTGGGGGQLPVRVDYPLRNDWRYIRKEPDSSKTKEELYREAALEVTQSEYWEPSLHLWGTQMIEKTKLGDPYGINSPSKSTAVRINIHLYRQLHYNSDMSEIDTEEDWED